MSKTCFVCGKELGFFDAKGLTADKKFICSDDINTLFLTKKASNSSIPLNLGMKINKLTSNQIEEMIKERTEAQEKAENGVLCCPYCASTNIQPLGQHKKGFSAGKAVGGAVLAASVGAIATAGVGALAGFAGKKTKQTDFVCMDCGKRFKK